jgi:hypothetical protein
VILIKNAGKKTFYDRESLRFISHAIDQKKSVKSSVKRRKYSSCPIPGLVIFPHVSIRTI